MMDKKALLNVKEMCEYLGIGQTKAIFAIYTKRHAEMVEKIKALW